MYSNNLWFHTNIKPHTEGKEEFKVDIAPYSFNALDFQSAAKMTAELISNRYKNIYLAYSGGLDSEFVLKTFVDNNLPITPVIVKTPHNTLETIYAIHFCRKHNLTPVILEFSEKELLDRIHRWFLTKFNHISPTCLCFIEMSIVMQHARVNDGVMLCGEHPISDIGKNDINSTMGKDIKFQSGPFYYHSLANFEQPAAFFYYTLEMFYATLKNIDYTMQLNEAKSKLFGLEYRPKLEHQNDTIYKNAVNTLANQMGFLTQNSKKLNDIVEFGDAPSFCKLMETKYIVGEQSV